MPSLRYVVRKLVADFLQ